MSLVYLTRIESFNAAHRLSNPEWTLEKNREVFGKCSNPNFHGHNYVLEVTVKGVVQEGVGFVFNAKTLSDIIKEEIVELLDHKNLNLDVPYFREVQPSVENICVTIWDILNRCLNEQGYADMISLHKIHLHESAKISAYYYG